MNPEVARVLNNNFVSIKVDRETRPDIDRLYMNFLVASTGSGGWPMTVFLTPDAQPFMAGTYFPQPARSGRISFLELLTQVAQGWSSDPDSLKANAADMASRMAEASRQPASSDVPGPDTREGDGYAFKVEMALRHWKGAFDLTNGGFGSAPKFPEATLLGFLLVHGALYPKSGSQSMALKTLEAMALGGIHDHLEGGFHRYSTDASWKVPHFEKMLSDQAQLLALYSRAYALTGKPVFKQAAQGIIDYLRERLALQSGGLASAEDADSVDPTDPSKHREGAFYLWRESQLGELLQPEQRTLVDKVFALSSKGNAGKELPGLNVLATAAGKDLSDPRLPAALRALREARSNRPRPRRDEKVLAAWNAMAVAAMVEASVALKQPELLGRARSVMEYLESSLVVDGKLRRSLLDGKPAEIAAFAQDHTEMVGAYLSLYAAAGEPADLRRAVFWQAEQDRLFADADGGGYYETVANHGLLYRDKELQDGALPSTASRSAMNLVRLYRITGREQYRQSYQSLLRGLGSDFGSSPWSLPGVLSAIDLMEGPEQSAVLVGDRPDWWASLQEGYHPERTLQWVRDDARRKALSSLVPSYLANLPPSQAVYFCQNFTCGQPITSQVELRQRLQR